METQNEVTPETLATLATTAATVAKDHEAFTEAIDTQNAAEAALLGRIIETVKPALRALASRIVKLDRSTSGQNGCNPVEQKEYFDERGVCLVDAFDREKDTTGNEGTYGGSRLYLLDDGRLAEVDREGTWSQWQGAWSGYEATLTIVDATTAQRHYHLTDMVEALNTKLEEQAKGSKAKRTKAAQARAEKLAAVASLVGEV
jgi:hypothetical protein